MWKCKYIYIPVCMYTYISNPSMFYTICLFQVEIFLNFAKNSVPLDTKKKRRRKNGFMFLAT